MTMYIGPIVMGDSEKIGFGVQTAFQAGLQAVGPYFIVISATYDISGFLAAILDSQSTIDSQIVIHFTAHI